MAKYAKLILQAVVTVGVLAYLFRVVPFDSISGALRSADLRYVMCGFALQALGRLPASLRMKLIADAQQLGITLSVILKTLFAATFYGLLLPGSIAGGATTFMKYVQHGARPGPVLVAMVVNRSAEMLTTIVAGAAYWIADRKLEGVNALLVLPAAFTLLTALHLLLFGRSHWLSMFMELIASRAWWRRIPLHRKLAGFAAHLARMRDLPSRSIFLVQLASLAQDLLAAFAVYLLSCALNLGLSFLTIAWMRVAVHLVVLLPISISGLGARESTLIFLTLPFGIAPAAAIAWSLLIFAGNLVAALSGGVFEVRALWARKSRVASNPAPDERT